MPNKQKGLDKKYKIRRLMLVVLGLSVLFVAGIIVGQQIVSEQPVEQVETQPQPTEPTPQPEPEPAPQPEAAPQLMRSPVVETEPEPEEPKTEDWQLILVNYANPLPDDFSVELERVSGDYRLDKRIAPTFIKMIADAKADGINLQLFSAYRDPEKQKEIFQNKLSEHMSNGLSEEEAYKATEKWIAPPGTSEHHTGLVVDIATPDTGITESFENTAAFQWLQENACKYGFILRYPKDKVDITKIQYEPWHYRYVGVEIAEIIWDNGYTLEEYLYSKELSEKKLPLGAKSPEEAGEGTEASEEEKPDETSGTTK